MPKRKRYDNEVVCSEGSLVWAKLKIPRCPPLHWPAKVVKREPKIMKMVVFILSDHAEIEVDSKNCCLFPGLNYETFYCDGIDLLKKKKLFKSLEMFENDCKTLWEEHKGHEGFDTTQAESPESETMQPGMTAKPITERCNSTETLKSSKTTVETMETTCHPEGGHEGFDTTQAESPESETMQPGMTAKPITERCNSTETLKSSKTTVETMETTCHPEGDHEGFDTPQAESPESETMQPGMTAKPITERCNSTETMKSSKTTVETMETTCHPEGGHEGFDTTQAESPESETMQPGMTAKPITERCNSTETLKLSKTTVETMETTCHPEGGHEGFDTTQAESPESETMQPGMTAKPITERCNSTETLKLSKTTVETMETTCHPEGGHQRSDTSQAETCPKSETMQPGKIAKPITERYNSTESSETTLKKIEIKAKDEDFSDIEDWSDCDPTYIPESEEDEDEEYEEDEDENLNEKVIVIPETDAEDVATTENDDRMSDIFPFPALIPKSQSIREEREDSSDDEIIDENDISRDLENKSIYVRLVIKNNFTKNGKVKKSNRVYNSTHPCPFCSRRVTNFSHHIMVHKDEEIVKKICRLEMNSKERKKEIQLLRLKGAHAHNVAVKESGKGEVFLLRRLSCVNDDDSDNDDEKTEKSFRFELYGPCPDCLGWILRRSMKRHQKTCCCKENSKNKNQTKSSLLVQSDIIAGNISPLASKALVEETYAIMTNDHITEVAKSDPLIVLLGNNWMLRNMGNRIMRKYYTSSTMRLNAKFKLALLKSLGNPKKDLVDLLIPSNYDLIAKAALSCCKIDEDEELGSPSNAIKLGYDVKRLISAKLAEAIKEGVKDRRKEAEQLLKLMDLDWAIKVKKLATITLQERAFNAPKSLPLPEDIQRLSNYMQNELKEISLEDVSCENFRRVAIITLARITLFNRRRAHEVQAMSLDSYRARKTGVDEVAKELTNDLTSFENYLLNTQEVVVIRGKTGKGVPCILPQDVLKPLQYLTSQDIRSKVTMQENRYVFANSNIGVFRAYDAIRSVSSKAGLKMPHLIRTSKMRKYFATMLQAIDTTQTQKQWVLDHLGHTMDVHNVHYRQTSDVIERVDVAKLLLIQDLGLVGKFKGKCLKDIQLQDVVQHVHDDDEAAPPAAVAPAEILEGNEDLDNDFEEDFIPEMPLSEDDMDEPVVEKPKKKKKTSMTKRQKWTLDEENEIETLFSKNFDKKHCPGQKEIRKAISISRSNDGHKTTSKRK